MKKYESMKEKRKTKYMELKSLGKVKEVKTIFKKLKKKTGKRCPC